MQVVREFSKASVIGLLALVYDIVCIQIGLIVIYNGNTDFQS